jgi:hypothetical protein
MKIKEVIQGLKNWANSSAPIDHFVQATKAGEAIMKNRIFNSESGAKDLKGKGLGKYSNPYAKYREKKGRQTRVVDLELTGSLRRGIDTAREADRVAIAVPDNTEAKKIEYLEGNYNVSIFGLTKAEKDFVIDQVSINFENDIKRIINGAN